MAAHPTTLNYSFYFSGVPFQKSIPAHTTIKKIRRILADHLFLKNPCLVDLIMHGKLLHDKNPEGKLLYLPLPEECGMIFIDYLHFRPKIVQVPPPCTFNSKAASGKLYTIEVAVPQSNNAAGTIENMKFTLEEHLDF